MPDIQDTLVVKPIVANTNTTQQLNAQPKTNKDVFDWVRDLRMSADVNKTTTGVETDHVTPELLLATSKKLLAINKGEAEEDAKDSLQFQRVYGPAEYFAEHILKDANKVGRQLLWKATNKGNLDFIQSGALNQHVSDVFNNSGLANRVDSSSPLESVEASSKVTRIGEGGVGDLDSAPEEMRLVQPSFLGYIDPVRSVECCSFEHEVFTSTGWKPIASVTTDDEVLCWVDNQAVYKKPEQVVSYEVECALYGYKDDNVEFEVTGNHRMWHCTASDKNFRFAFAEEVFKKPIIIALNEQDACSSGLYQLRANRWYRENYESTVYCLTVPGGIFYTRIGEAHGMWIGNSLKVGLDGYLTKHCMRGTDGKLYQRFINAHTGKEELVDSVTAAKSIVTTPDQMLAKTKNVYAVGGKKGIRIVKKTDVDYYLPHMDDAFTTAANTVPNYSGVKELRLNMGCLHPMTNMFYSDEVGCWHMLTAAELVKQAYVTRAEGRVIRKDIQLAGMQNEGEATLMNIRGAYSKFPDAKHCFRKVVLYSGRALVTTLNHRWSVIRNGVQKLIPCSKLKPGDKIPRTLFKDVQGRRTFIFDHYKGNRIQLRVTETVAFLLGLLARDVHAGTEEGTTITVYPQQVKDLAEKAINKVRELDSDAEITFYTSSKKSYIRTLNGWFGSWALRNFGADAEHRTIPSCILSATTDVVLSFIAGYTADDNNNGLDQLQNNWILNIPNPATRDAIAFLLARTGVDSYYRDGKDDEGNPTYALRLLDEPKDSYKDCVLDEVKKIVPATSAAVMIDFDVNDNLYATANGIITHNSKYPQQAISLENREAPLVRNLDSASGKDYSSTLGKFLGARYASKPGVVTAVRDTRIDMQYDDGTKGSIALYRNFPMNAKGYLNNKALVKAGQHVDKDTLVASSNYTDDNGVAAIGTNLRTGWLSWKGGTYEDAIVLSETAAKKLTSDTMYTNTLDLDKTITLGKRNYLSWKPQTFTGEQLDKLDDDGIVKPGTVLHKGDPVTLAVRTEAPSPGTMGKRILTDLSETWEHEHPGTVTDVIRTRNGVKVLTTVSAPTEVGDKLSGCFDDQTEVFTESGFKLFKDLKATDRVAVLHEDNTATFELPLSYQTAHYKGCMIEYQSLDVNFKVTPDHQMAFVPRYAYEKGSRCLVRKQAAEVYKKRIFMRLSASFKLKPEHKETAFITLEPFKGDYRKGQATAKRLLHIFNRIDFAAFLGIYLAEGHCATRNKEHWIRISQFDTTEEGRQRCQCISTLLDTMGVDWHYYRHEYFMLSNWALHQYVKKLGKSAQKYIPEDVFTTWSSSEMQTLLDWFYMGDGEMRATETWQRCATISKRLADDIQRLYILTGYASKVRSTKAVNSSVGLCYKISARKADFVCVGTDREYWHIDDTYDGMIYCIRSTTGVILTRRKGIAMWNGQCFGNKGVVSQILPDDQMPQDKDGKPLELLFSPLGLITRTNSSQLTEALLGKVAKKTGKPEIVPAFYNGDMHQYVADKLKQYNLKADEDFFDPETGRKMSDVVNGYSYIYKLKHLSESKMSERGTEGYSADETPGGSGTEKAKRFGSLEQSALAGHAAYEILKDNKLIRGQANSDFWRSLRTGTIPVMPGEPLVQRKFFAHLQGAGVNVRKTNKGISVFALSNGDVNELSGPRELKSADTYETKNFRPIDGGLFGQDVFGMNGDKWGYIQLDEPLPNPVMAQPLAKLLNISDKDFVAICTGEKEVNGMSSAADMKARLAKINLTEASKQAQQEFKNANASNKDKALKRFVAIEQMRRLGRNPEEYMLDRIPVLPPAYRPITSSQGMTMVADANYLYKQLLEARDDMRDAKDLPEEYQKSARKNIYNKWQELTGMYDVESPKLKSKNVGGLLQWALGKGSPKFSAVQRKIIGATVDTVGRGAIVPSTHINVDQIGIPVKMAFGIMAPFVERALVKRGYTPIAAMQMVKQQNPQALEVLKETMQTHPVLMNRAPTLHKYSIMAFKPQLVQGNAIQVHPSICPGFGADFDGDTVLNLTQTVVSLEVLKEKAEKSRFNDLTSLEHGIYSAYLQNNKGEDTMISSDTKCLFATATASLSELPVVAGSAIQKSANAIEWDVQPGFYTDTVDPSTGKHALAQITKVSKHSGLKMYNVALSAQGSFSHIVTAAEDHSLITLNPETLQLEKTKPADAVGRLVPRVIKNLGNANEHCARYIHIDKEYPASFDMGFLIGAMLGDGWVDNVNCMRIACCDTSLQEYFLALLSKTHSLIPMTKDAKLWSYEADEARFSSDKAQRITIYATKEFKQALKRLIGDGAYNKHIPEDCLMGSRAHLAGILMGLLATDGTVNYSEGTKAKKSTGKTVLIHTTSALLRDGIQALCTRLGIRTTVTAYRGNNSKSDCFAVTLSVRDLAREAKLTPSLFQVHHKAKQEALDKIILEVSNSTNRRSDRDIMPMPGVLRGEFIFAKASKLIEPSIFSDAMDRNYGCSSWALDALQLMRNTNWDSYKESSYIVGHKHNHTPTQAKELVERWIAIVENTEIAWERVDKVEESSCTEGWDCTVPGPYTFTLSTGTVVQDTVNIHVPVSDKARKEALDKMLPSKNLIALSNHAIMNKPEKEFAQGIYIATRMGKSPTGRAPIFRNMEEAREAYRKGVIDVDTPITLLNGK